jgi:hypothetical protein
MGQSPCTEKVLWEGCDFLLELIPKKEINALGIFVVSILPCAM